jgi:hypothetical protein
MIANLAGFFGHRLRSRPGQVIVIVALLLPAMLGMVGVALDIANLYLHKRAAQNAADLAALAGANDLPGAASSARTSAISFASKNGFQDRVDSATVSVSTPYNGDAGKIEVVIRQYVPGIFVRALGLGATPVTARAVAYRIPQNYAIFEAGDCTGTGRFDFAGSSLSVTGDVHSNSDLNVYGSNNGVNGAVTYACTSAVYGNDNTFTRGPTRVAQRALPVQHSTAEFQPCTYSISGNFNVSSTGPWWSNSSTLRPGTYCATGDLSLNSSGANGTVTFVAGGQIQVNGSNYTLRPFKNGVLMYSSSAGSAISVNGSGGRWSGMLYAPNGQVSFNGSSTLTLSGSIIGGTVSIAGSSWTLQGGTHAARSQLVE